MARNRLLDAGVEVSQPSQFMEVIFFLFLLHSFTSHICNDSPGRLPLPPHRPQGILHRAPPDNLPQKKGEASVIPPLLQTPLTPNPELALGQQPTLGQVTTRCSDIKVGPVARLPG